MYPGQFPNIKANLFNTVLALDLSQVSSINFIVGPVSNIIERGLPFRFGVAPIIETEEGKTGFICSLYLGLNHIQERKWEDSSTMPSITMAGKRL